METKGLGKHTANTGCHPQFGCRTYDSLCFGANLRCSAQGRCNDSSQSRARRAQLLDLLQSIAISQFSKELNYNKGETHFSLILSLFYMSAEGDGSCQKVRQHVLAGW